MVSYYQKIYKIWAKKVRWSYFSLYWTIMQKLTLWFQKRHEELGELSLEPWQVKSFTLMGSFCPKHKMLQLESSIGIMTLKGNAKLKGKLTYSLKTHKRNLVNFHASSRKTENLHFDGLLLSKAYKEEWCRVWRKTEPWFQKWHKEYGEGEQWQLWKIEFWCATFVVSVLCLSPKMVEELCHE